MLKNQKGFTLTELIVTIAVSGIFFAIIGSIIISLFTSYKNAEMKAEREAEISSAWNFIEETIADTNSLGEGLIISTGEDNLSFGKAEAGLLYDKNQASLCKNNNVLFLKYIKTLDFEIINPQTVAIFIFDDNENSHLRIYYLFGGVEIEGEGSL